MILYLDASALVKCYVQEARSDDVRALVDGAELVGTSLVSRAEVSAALAKASRIGVITREEAANALSIFRSQWQSIVRIQIHEHLVARADELTWQHGLRGYDAIHLAAMLTWGENLGDSAMTLATFDKDLWWAAHGSQATAWPPDLVLGFKPRK